MSGKTLAEMLADDEIADQPTAAEIAEGLAACEMDDRLTEIRNGIRRAVASNDPATACSLMLEECRLLVAAIAAHVPRHAGRDWAAHAELDQLRSSLRQAARLS